MPPIVLPALNWWSGMLIRIDIADDRTASTSQETVIVESETTKVLTMITLVELLGKQAYEFRIIPLHSARYVGPTQTRVYRGGHKEYRVSSAKDEDSKWVLRYRPSSLPTPYPYGTPPFL